MRYVGDCCLALAIGITCTLMAFGPLIACTDDPPSTDAGADPEISDCCYGLFVPWRASPQSCLESLTDPGECRWLTCLGGILTYEACK